VVKAKIPRKVGDVIIEISESFESYNPYRIEVSTIINPPNSDTQCRLVTFTNHAGTTFSLWQAADINISVPQSFAKCL